MDELKNKDTKLLFIFAIIYAILIVIIRNINIDYYLRTFILPLIFIIMGYIYLSYKNKIIKNKNAYYILIPIVLILLSNFIFRVDESNMFLNIFILPVMIAIFLFRLTTNNEINLYSKKWIFKLFPKGIFSNLKYIKTGFKNDKSKNSVNIILGLLIGIPIGLLLLTLLASADKYFGSLISSILRFIPNITFDKISNIFVLIASFILFFSVFINVMINNKNKLLEIKEKKDINITISKTILIIVNLVFAIFLISEISKLTNNFLNLPIEYTYANYAREGFFQLLAVTSINFLIINYHLYVSKITNNKFIKNMLIVLISFSILLILNSYYRMFLYINAYSFTILRLQVLLFLTMELIFFILFMLKTLNKLNIKENNIYPIILSTFYILNIYLCSNWFIKLIS